MVQILSRTSQITQIGKADSLKMSCLQVRLLYLVFTLSRMICRDYNLCKVQSQTSTSRREALRRTGALSEATHQLWTSGEIGSTLRTFGLVNVKREPYIRNNISGGG